MSRGPESMSVYASRQPVSLTQARLTGEWLILESDEVGEGNSSSRREHKDSMRPCFMIMRARVSPFAISMTALLPSSPPSLSSPTPTSPIFPTHARLSFPFPFIHAFVFLMAILFMTRCHGL